MIVEDLTLATGLLRFCMWAICNAKKNNTPPYEDGRELDEIHRLHLGKVQFPTLITGTSTDGNKDPDEPVRKITFSAHEYDENNNPVNNTGLHVAPIPFY